jgi:putative transposase
MSSQASYPIATMSRVLGVSKSGFYAWIKRQPSARMKRDQELSQKIRECHQASKGTYGAPRIQADLKAEGISIGKKRIARLMREHGLCGVSRRKGLITARRAEKAPPSPDLVERQFKASHINELWVADITYIPTWTGFLYLAVVLDACSRKIVGWSMALSLHTQIVLDALEMALWQRRPKNVIHHSDQGSQYTSLAFGNRCQEAGVRPSMGSVGDAYDNAMCESFFATLECELLNRRRFKTQAEAKMAVFEFIEGFYNPRRRHSALGYMAPDAYEALALPSGSSYRAAVLVPVKGRPQTMGNEAEPGATAALDRDCARQQSLSARRDGKTASTEQKDGGCSPLINP